ncbi:VOC family protein [Nocardia cyriacigeorgica]|uniref:Predicted enzyme related to lactoylglutathione lyase n=1 Tax=Nocardia cyriacigeorgica TaxID=135487 RepID=A0A4U8W2U5_9NOCA|nr:VOC family protein [Nocardia cyriacigeorgica]MBF6161447.1 VOC family protein [Nocardia cyriacigeorgica]MBF6200128.1 VOC family protein [Nocardia cyriacigeorgica]MBF6318582.1 VOC family protein [Nocardia cyriacigeorgica]MBF6346614.1 VOC family protein [Nocardia cyriacigeorgica]MBF6496889.1 VOC family protein [Nocardia cyriacigeorgica]
MTIRRATPDIRTTDMAASRAFYRGLGFTEAMDLGWAVIMASPSTPTTQVVLVGPEAEGPQPDMSVEVDDVDAVHARLVAAGADIVYALRDEPWGVRRFFVRDPSGTVVNVVTHGDESA